MHIITKELLPDAEGRSEFVIVLFLDIRSFSAFSRTVESTQVAVFIKKFYLKIIENFFLNASFFKPTGDGLLVIIPFNEKNLIEVVEKIFVDCFEILTKFNTFFIDDPMINFKVPENVGIGIARGSACYLISQEKIIDYSGNILNLSARLMDVARPSGIVFDSSFGINLLPKDLQKKFQMEKIYLRGLAEDEPMDIYISKDFTKISPLMRHPLNEINWEKIVKTQTFAELIKKGPRFTHDLPSVPIEPNKIQIKFVHPAMKNKKTIPDVSTSIPYDKFNYYQEAGKPKLTIDYTSMISYLSSIGVKTKSKISLEIIYKKLNS